MAADNKYFNDDAIKAKLSSLNETQEVIVNVAQWLLFNKRMAVRTAEIWSDKVKNSQPAKRLSLVYLANEVVQQSRARKRDEFVNAFAPHIADAMTASYRSAPFDMQQKLKRVVEVWRARTVFPPAVQADIEAHLEEIDRARVTKRTLGGSLFGSSALTSGDENGAAGGGEEEGGGRGGGGGGGTTGTGPIIPRPLIPVSEALVSLQRAQGSSNEALDKYEAAKANGALASSATAGTAAVPIIGTAKTTLAATVSARRALIGAVELLLSTQKDLLAADQKTAAGLDAHLSVVQAPAPPFEKPDIEALTPPPVEALTPPTADADADADADAAQLSLVESPKRSASSMDNGQPANMAILSQLLGLPPAGVTPEPSLDSADNRDTKRRKIEDETSFEVDIDPAVEEMLAK